MPASTCQRILCSTHRCTICKQKTTFPLCEKCEALVTQKLFEWNASAHDKAALFNSQILPSFLYAPYTCITQQQWMSKTYKAIHRAITKINYGGYNAIYALKPKEGGIGLPQFADHLLYTTVNTINREMVPCCIQAQQSIYHARCATQGDRTRWPASITTALGKITLHLHPSLRNDETLSSQQESSRCMAVIHHKWNTREHLLQSTIEVRSNTINLEPFGWSTTHKTAEAAVIRTTAILITKLQQHHNHITIHLVHPATEKIIKEYDKLHPRQQTYHQQSAELHKFHSSNTKVLFGALQPFPDSPRTDNSYLPLHRTGIQLYTFPLYAQIAPGYHSSSCITEFIANYLAEERYQSVRQCPQFDEVFNGRTPNWEYSSIIFALQRAGTHYIQPLTPQDSNLLLSLRAGALTKTGSRNCTCGAVPTLSHLIHHIPPPLMQEQIAQVQQLYTNSELAKHHQLPTTYLQPSISTCLGWVYGNLTTLSMDANHKQHKTQIQKILTCYCKLLIDTAKKTLLDHSPGQRNQIPHFELPPPPEIRIPTEGWTITSDAALNPDNPIGIGIGITIQYNATILLRKRKFIPAQSLPQPITSTIAEYAAATFGLETLDSISANNRCINNTPIFSAVICIDNLNVPNQAVGEWNINNLPTLEAATAFRQIQTKLRTNQTIDSTPMWIPRHLNHEADTLAKLALREKNPAPQ